MSTTEGLWSTKIFKIKGGMWETIVGPKKRFENGGNLEKINRRKVVVKIGEIGEEKNKEEGNNDKEINYESESKIGGERIEMNREEEDKKKSGKEIETDKEINNNNNNNNNENNLDEESASEEWESCSEEVKGEDGKNKEAGWEGGFGEVKGEEGKIEKRSWAGGFWKR